VTYLVHHKISGKSALDTCWCSSPTGDEGLAKPTSHEMPTLSRRKVIQKAVDMVAQMIIINIEYVARCI